MSASMAAAKLLRQRCVNEPVEMAVLLGTGLGPLSGALEGPITVSYQDLPGS
jgi:purine nucleoside phosphorylase